MVGDYEFDSVCEKVFEDFDGAGSDGGACDLVLQYRRHGWHEAQRGLIPSQGEMNVSLVSAKLRFLDGREVILGDDEAAEVWAEFEDRCLLAEPR